MLSGRQGENGILQRADRTDSNLPVAMGCCSPRGVTKLSTRGRKPSGS